MKNSVAAAWAIPAPARTVAEKAALNKHGDTAFGEAVRAAHMAKPGHDKGVAAKPLSPDPARTSLAARFTAAAERAVPSKDAPSSDAEHDPLADEPAVDSNDAAPPGEYAPAAIPAVVPIPFRAPLAAALGRHDYGQSDPGPAVDADAQKTNMRDAPPAPADPALTLPDGKEPSLAEVIAPKADGKLPARTLAPPVIPETPTAYSPHESMSAAGAINRDSGRETVRERPNRSAEAAPKEATGKPSVVVVADQSFPAPAIAPTAPAASAILGAIAGENSWREAAAAAENRVLPPANAVSSAHALKIQLHPAELGVVTASLRYAGEQLTIELQVESVDAQQQLDAEKDAIIKSLRALGLEVDQVTVRQSLPPPQAQTRLDDASFQPGSAARDQQSFDARNPGERSGQSGGRPSGRDSGNGENGHQNAVSGAPARTGGGLYI